MHILGILLVAIGMLIGLFFGIQLMIVAFRTSVWWGLGCIMVPLVDLIFVIVHWSVAKRPFLFGLLAIPFYVVGGIMLDAR